MRGFRFFLSLLVCAISLVGLCYSLFNFGIAFSDTTPNGSALTFVWVLALAASTTAFAWACIALSKEKPRYNFTAMEVIRGAFCSAFALTLFHMTFISGSLRDHLLP